MSLDKAITGANYLPTVLDYGSKILIEDSDLNKNSDYQALSTVTDIFSGKYVANAVVDSNFCKEYVIKPISAHAGRCAETKVLGYQEETELQGLLQKSDPASKVVKEEPEKIDRLANEAKHESRKNR